MNYNPENHQRSSVRLRGYDYSQPGAYFVTICTQGRMCLLGDISGGEVQVTAVGGIVKHSWYDLPSHYRNIELDEFVVMPNHVHGIVIITDHVASTVGAGFKPAPTPPQRRHALPEIVRGFKTFSSRRINLMRSTPGHQFWQRNYYEHIIRSENELDQVRRYIQENPAKWADDVDNPKNHAGPP